MSGLWSKSAEAARRHDGIGSLGRGGVPDRNQAAQDRRFRRDRRKPDDRSDDRHEDRPRDAAAVAAARRGGSELELEQLRRRLQLFVHELDLVDRPADAARRDRAANEPAPDGAEPAGRLRAVVRLRRHAGNARRAHARESQHPRLGAGGTGEPFRTRSARPTAGRSISTPTKSARSNGASSWPRRPRRTVPEIDLPPGIPDSFDEHIKLQFDLAALAFRRTSRAWPRCSARAISRRARMCSRRATSFPNGGVSPGFHGASHHQDDPVQIKRYADINRYHVSTLRTSRRS